MKHVYFIECENEGFDVDVIDDKILICTFGHSHVFNYPSVLVKSMSKYAKKIIKNNIKTYFDLSSVLGETASNKYFVITYDKNKKDFIYHTKRTLKKLPIKLNKGDI